MTKLEKKLEEYIEFLGEALSENAGFLMVHGITTPDEIIEKGKKFREEIKQLKEIN